MHLYAARIRRSSLCDAATATRLQRLG